MINRPKRFGSNDGCGGRVRSMHGRVWDRCKGWRRWRWTRGALLAAALGEAATLPATTVDAPSFDELVAGAEIVFEGRVSKRDSRWVGKDETRRIKTFYSLRVDEVLKGEVASPYVLEVLGGTVGETTLKVEGAPEFSVGDQVILFVTDNGTQFVPLVGIMHGHYKFDRDPATQRERVVRHDGSELHDIGEIGTPSAVAKLARSRADKTAPAPLTPHRFKAEIREKVRNKIR